MRRFTVCAGFGLPACFNAEGNRCACMHIQARDSRRPPSLQLGSLPSICLYPKKTKGSNTRTALDVAAQSSRLRADW